MAAFIFTPLLFYTGFSAYCSPNAANGHPNLNSFAEANYQFINQVPNGKLYIAGPPEQQLYIAHLYGTPYEMGYAHGQLLSGVVQQFIDEVWQYIISEIPGAKIFYPELANMTIQDALQAEIDATRPFTPDYWMEEMRGLADASGVEFEDIYRVHMLPELTKGSCSMFGAYGNATIDSTNGVLMQLRALDWDTDGPFKDYPAMLVYHPSAVNANVFASLGFTGFIGSITGISAKRVSISEIGVYFSDSTWGTESRFGYPFIFVLRDILMYDNTVLEATARLQDAHRTCDLLLGVGHWNASMGNGMDADSNYTYFSGYQYSHSVLNVYEWYNLEPYNQTWHPRIQDITYWAMDWDCPGYNQIMSEQLMKYYGSIDAENTIKYITAITQTGNLHIAIYDYYNDDVYISIAAKSDENTAEKYAYQRQFIRFHLNELFLES